VPRASPAERVDFALLAVPTVAAAAAVLAFDLGVRAVGLWVLVELSTTLVLYCGTAMVTSPEEDVRTRERVGPPGPIGWVDSCFDADSRVSLPFLPPVSPRNLRFVVPTLLLSLVPVLGVSGALAAEGWGFEGRRGRGGGPSVLALFAQFVAFEQPAVAAVGALVAGAHVLRFYRCHVATGQYEEWTTHMLLDVQGTYTVLYSFSVVAFVLYAILSLVVVGVAARGVVGDATGRAVWLALVAGSAVLAKLAFEWSRVRGERRPGLTDGSFTANFAPTPPDRAARSEDRDGGGGGE
jgi:hypothetical protein